MSYVEEFTNACERFNNASDLQDRARSILLLGAVLPRIPNLPHVTPHSLLGLAHTMEQAQWQTMFDIANSAHKMQLKDIREHLGRDEGEPFSQKELLEVAVADLQRPEGEKVIWNDEQYVEFVRDFYDTIGHVYTLRVERMLTDYFDTQCEDEQFASMFNDDMTLTLVRAANESAAARVLSFMGQGYFKRCLPQFIAEDGMELQMQAFVSHIGGLVSPIADPETKSRLMGWE